MGRFGFGAGPAHRSRRPRGGQPAAPALPAIAPSAAWSGAAGSGFATVPADPPRTTAKPALRMIVPPNQCYADSLLVGVYAGANDGGSLLVNMGLTAVTAHYEGSAVAIPEPSFQTFADANGRPVTYFGWWIRLAHDGRHGHARLYFEATPRDAAMQNRVIGPYQFSPQPARHDLELEVAASPPEIAGRRYKTLSGALAYIRGTARPDNPRITITEGGSYDPLDGYVPNADNGGQGWTTITATVPATIARAALTTDAAALVRINRQRVRWAGANLSLDMRNLLQLGQGTPGQSHWLDGCRMTNSVGSNYAMWRGSARPIIPLSGRPYLTEAVCEFNPDPGSNAELVRGCEFRDGWNDLADNTAISIGNTFHRWDSTAWASDVPAMTVTYSGPEATASLSATGGNNAPTRTFTARWGANSATYVISRTEANFAAGTNYWFSNVIDWLNGLNVGFSAQLLHNARNAATACLPDTKGVDFSNADCKGRTLAVASMFDLHNDVFQNLVGGLAENFILADNRVYDVVAQCILWNTSAGVKDALVVNNAFHNRMADGRYDTNVNLFSQLCYTLSHAVIAHNSWASQGVILRRDVALASDARCLFASNVVRSLAWQGTPGGAMVIAGNHLQDGRAVPAGASETTTGGDDRTQFAAADAGDFAPTGALLANLKTPVLRYDRAGKVRGSTAAAGAVAAQG